MKQTKILAGSKRFLVQDIGVNPDCEYLVAQNAELTILVTAAGNKSANGSVRIRLTGGGAQANILGAFVNGLDTVVNLTTLQQHEAPATTSNLLIKSILCNGARFSYNGAIRVEHAGQKTDAYQRNENLLLSDSAHAQSKPSLEILADDVRCTHGATIGTVDQEQLMYLQTRGIPLKFGKQLIVEGFLDTVLSKASDMKAAEKVKEVLWQTLSKQQL